MRKSGSVLIAIILLLAVFILLVLGVYLKTNKTSKQQIPEEDTFVNYSPPAGSFSVSYPKSWEIRLLGNDGAEFKNPDTGSFIAIDTTVGSDINRESIDKIIETLQGLLKAESSPVSNAILNGRTGKEFRFDAEQPITGDGRAIVICCVIPNPKSSKSRPQEFYMLVTINNGKHAESKIIRGIIDSFKIEPIDWENLYK